jgi:low affinity Fe/Cu permease
MPGIFLALTIISGVSFALALTWVILQWVRADREAERAERELKEQLRRIEEAKHPALHPEPHEAQ